MADETRTKRPSSESSSTPARPGSAIAPSNDEIREAIKIVEDPEIGISIVDLGLVYGVENVDGDVAVTMTLTSPFCPIGPMLISQIETVVEELPGVKGCKVELVWSPPWDPKTMASDDAKDLLGIW